MEKNEVLSLIMCFSLILVLPFVASAKQFQVGVTPAVINLGEINPGESKRGSFVITTTSDEGFMVGIDVNRGSLGFFDGRYGYILEEYSEEDASEWVNFLNVPIYLDTETGSSGSSTIRAEQINFIVSVPEDAEPGYHLVEIAPNPEVPSGWSTAVNIVAITKIHALFRVSGEVERDGDVLEINARNVGSRTMVDVLFHNTGSVSMFAAAKRIDLYDTGGNLLENIWSTRTFARPGEIVKLTGFVTDALEPGSYLVTANVSYVTGNAAKETDIWIEGVPGQAAPAPGDPPQEAAFPWWILIIAILVFGYIIYRYV